MEPLRFIYKRVWPHLKTEFQLEARKNYCGIVCVGKHAAILYVQISQICNGFVHRQLICLFRWFSSQLKAELSYSRRFILSSLMLQKFAIITPNESMSTVRILWWQIYWISYCRLSYKRNLTSKITGRILINKNLPSLSFILAESSIVTIIPC